MDSKVKDKIEKVKASVDELRNALEELANEIPTRGDIGALKPNFYTTEIGVFSDRMESWLSIDEIESILEEKDYLEEDDFDF